MYLSPFCGSASSTTSLSPGSYAAASPVDALSALSPGSLSCLCFNLRLILLWLAFACALRSPAISSKVRPAVLIGILTNFLYHTRMWVSSFVAAVYDCRVYSVSASR
jgi:hypothetical protein